MSKSHMYTDMLIKADGQCRSLIRAEDNDNHTLLLKAIATIICGNLRMFIRDKSEIEVYQTLKEIPSLKKIHATDKHRIATYILEFM